MRHDNVNDPRRVLCERKYFSLRPKPLEQWLWHQGVPQAAERVFWVHWEEGMRSGDWCSQLSLKRVASLCCIDPSTVTRAYQLLRELGLIRREDPGRDPANPFQQATALTEVRLPRELLTELSRAPDRQRRASAAPSVATDSGAGRAPPLPTESIPAQSPAAAPTGPRKPANRLSHRDYQRIQGKLSSAEKTAYSRAWADRLGTMRFDAGTALTPDEQEHILWQLHLMTVPAESPPATATRQAEQPSAAYTGPRRLTPLEAARLRRQIVAQVAEGDQLETLRQVRWAVEEGALRRFEPGKAINIALKKIREGQWSRPHRMPPQWRLPTLDGNDAPRETCSAA